MANTAFTHDPTITVPVSSVNNRVVTWNGTTGKVFNNTATVTIAAGVVAGVTALTVDNLTIDGNTIISTDTNGNITLTPDGTGSVVMDTMTFNGNLLDVQNNGTASAIRLYCENSNAHYQEIKAAPHGVAATYSIILPGAAPTAAGKVLKSSGSSPYSTLEWGDAGGGNAFTNDVTVTSGNFVMGTADKGIDFAVTGNSSGTMQSEVLDDYEEGIFSPTMLFAGANTGISYTEQSGTYTKIGDRVIYSIRLRVANKGSSTGSLQIGGFPFAVGTGTRNYTAHTLYWDKIACTGTLIGYNAVGASYLDIRTVNDSGTNADVTDSGVTNGLTFHIAGTYSVRNIA